MAVENAAGLLSEMRHVRAHVVKEGDALIARWQPTIERPAFLASARNLAQYLALLQLAAAFAGWR